MTFEAELDAVLADIRAMLLSKNRDYGDSALNPLRVFSKASARDGLCVRIDDKLSRICRGAPAGEDVVRDLLGYLVLLRIHDARRSGERVTPQPDGLRARLHEQDEVIAQLRRRAHAPGPCRLDAYQRRRVSARASQRPVANAQRRGLL